MSNLIKETWRGRRPLWQAFWLLALPGYVAVTLLIFMTFGLAVDWLRIENPYILGILPFPFIISYFCFVIPSVWRCGGNSTLAWRWLSRLFILFLLVINISGAYGVWTYWIPHMQQQIGEKL